MWEVGGRDRDGGIATELENDTQGARMVEIGGLVVYQLVDG